MALSKVAFLIFRKDIIISILNFLTSVIIVRKLGLTTLGIWSILQMISSYIEAFGRSKSDITIVYFIGKKKLSISDIFININFILLLNILILGFILIINNENIYNLFFNKIEINYIYHYYFLLLTLPFSFLLTCYTYFFQAIEDFNTYNRIIILETLLRSFLIIILLNISDLGLWCILFSYFISPFITLIYAIFKLPKNIFSEGKISIKICISFLRYASQFYLNSIITQIYNTGTNFVATTLLLPQYIGLLSINQKIGDLIRRVITPIKTPFYPLISKSTSSEALNKTIKAFRIIFLLNSLLILGTCLLIRPFVEILYGKEFMQVTYIFYIVMPGLLLENTSLILKTYCNGIGKAIVSSYILIYPLVIQIISSFFLIKYFSFYGAAISISLGKALYGILFIFWFISFNKIRLKQVLPKKEDFFYIIYFVKNNFKIKNISRNLK